MDSNEFSTNGGIVARTSVTVSGSEVRTKIAEIGAFISAALEGWKHDAVHLDEIPFGLEISSKGVVSWIFGAEAKGTASLKFKLDH